MVDACILDDAYLVFRDLFVGLHQHFTRVGVEDVFRRDAAENTVTELLDDLASLHQRSNLDALQRATVVFGDDAILSHVHQTAGQIA